RVMRLLERMRRIGLRGTVRDVFEHPVLRDLASVVSGRAQPSVQVPVNPIASAEGAITPAMVTMLDLTQEQIDRIVSTVTGGASNLQDIYPLAPFQEGVLFHHLLSERGDAYVSPLLFEARSRRDLDALVQ